MQAIAIVGPKKSGKTTLGVRLAQALKDRGFQVAAAKTASHHFDKADTDTDKYRAVCAGTMGIGPGESFVSWPEKRFLSDLVPLIRADVLLVEGGKDLGLCPRVLLPAALGEPERFSPELAVACFGDKGLPGVPAVDSVEALADLVLARGFLLPGLDCGACGHEDCRSLAVEIVAGRAGPTDCKSQNSSLSIRVNGSVLALNPFVERMLAGGIRGLICELKGYAPGRIELELEGR